VSELLATVRTFQLLNTKSGNETSHGFILKDYARIAEGNRMTFHYYRAGACAVFFLATLSSTVLVKSPQAQAQSVPGMALIPTSPGSSAMWGLKMFPPHIMRALGTNVPTPHAEEALVAVAGTACSPPPPANPSSFYPADLTSCGGPVLTNATMHAVFINCAPSFLCWGQIGNHPTPQIFLNDYNLSTLAQVTNQYVNSSATNRYPQGNYYYTNGYKISNNLIQDIDIFNFLNGLINAGAPTGLGHLYHIFFQSGIDVCHQTLTGSTSCYAPDNRFPHQLCGFHSFMTYNNGNNYILYTIQPYQDVALCKITGGPNEVNDSTASTLSHEITESITNPLANYKPAWFNTTSLPLAGNEIGDECQMLNVSLYPTLTVNQNQYKMQMEYSNTYHDCAAKP
jgi:hypothetical protein